MINQLYGLLASTELVDAKLWQVPPTDREPQDSIESVTPVAVECRDKFDLLDIMRAHWLPQHVSGDNPKLRAPRLVGWYHVDGDPVLLTRIARHRAELNANKQKLLRLTKRLYPIKHERERFLETDSLFKPLIMHSVHRQLPAYREDPLAIAKRCSFSWSSHQQKPTAFASNKECLDWLGRYYGDHANYKHWQEQINDTRTHGLQWVHHQPVPVHPVQSITWLCPSLAELTVRRHNKCHTPLLVLGSTPFKSRPLLPYSLADQKNGSKGVSALVPVIRDIRLSLREPPKEANNGD
ncbi:hypothetical protein LRP52_44875 [Photobacterium sp. ZSDE20]|nr:hypothetical protein [Photobacterium sp. ZSDE20]